MTHRTITTLLAVLTLAVAYSSASAAIIVEERFDYTTGSNLPGQNGGTGFDGAWVDTYTSGGNKEVTIDSNGQAFADHNGSAARDLLNPVTSGVRYIAFKATFINDHSTALIMRWGTGTRIRLGTAAPAGNDYANNPSTVTISHRTGGDTYLHDVDNTERLYVIEVDQTSTTPIGGPLDVLKVWVDPTSQADPYAVMLSETSLEFNNIFMTANRVAGNASTEIEFRMDDFVIADTFFEASGVPEPATMALLGIGGAATLLRRKHVKA